MMTDRELLQLAAKAAGIVGTWATGRQTYGDADIEGIDTGARFLWNPLVSDGDALRLAVKLRIQVTPAERKCVASWWVRSKLIHTHYVIEETDGCELAAVRRAIVRGAAEIGEQHE